MGSYIGIETGPYLIVTAPTKPEKYTIKSCPNTDCKNHGKEKGGEFCGKCGTKIERITLERTFQLDWRAVLMDVNKKWEDSFGAPHNGGSSIYEDKDILTPNDRSFDKLEIDGSYGQDYPMWSNGTSLIDPSGDVEKMKDFYAGQIKALLDANFEIEYHWGVIVSYA